MVVGSDHRPTVFCVHGDGDEHGTAFGAAIHKRQHVEFTDEGDVVVATRTGGTVYSGMSLEPVRSWTWLHNVRCVYAIQAYRGRLHVLCAMGRCDYTEVHAYK